MSKSKTAKQVAECATTARHSGDTGDIHVAVRVITEELAKIAREIEEMPNCSCGQMDAQTMMRMQMIDFCSQRLMDLSAMVRQLPDGASTGSPGLLDKMHQTARLEHIQNLLKEAS